ncbi:GSCOCG00010471001-RA-CDS [Cotesia congregata]|nr:GSCOCG00010471001-RA-CDS [Cotesia congregata]
MLSSITRAVSLDRLSGEIRMFGKLSKNPSNNNLDMDYLNLGFLALELRETVSKTLSSIKNELKQSLSEKSAVENKNNNKNVSNKSESNLKTITLEELSWHDTIDDCWIAIYDYVYDCTEFMIKHPGGGDVLCEYAGRDGTIAFISTGHSESAVNLLDKYLIGELPPSERLFRSENGVKVIL